MSAKEAKLASRTVLIRPYQPGDIDRLYEAVRESITELPVRMPRCHAGYCIEESRARIEPRVGAWAKGTECDLAMTELSKLAPDC